MRFISFVATFLLLTPLIFGHTNCSEGSEPETVVVPVGEPSYTGEDPYDTEGEMGCGSDTGAVQAAWGSRAADDVIVSFVGTQDVWVFRLTHTEFDAVKIELSSIFTNDDLTAIDRRDVDSLQADLCADSAEQTERGRRLESALRSALGARMDELAPVACAD